MSVQKTLILSNVAEHGRNLTSGYFHGVTHCTYFVLLGDEGDGKTWAVASWINWQIQHSEDFPPVIFLSSSHPSSTEPASLLSEAISRQINQQDRTYWEKRLNRWVQRPIGEIPLILLVLDGINERRTPQWWRELMEGLMASPWREQMAVLITARTCLLGPLFSHTATP